MAIASNEIMRAAAIINAGGIVAFPTETVYGLGANALNATAVAKIFAAKQRPKFDPLIVHIHDMNQLPLIAKNIPRQAGMLIERFWPGPLTIVVPKNNLIPDIVTAGLPNVGIRMPNHPVALALAKEAGVPIAAPSANKFGCISPTCADHVREQLQLPTDAIVDGGSCTVGIESTIVSFTHEKPLLLRPGGLPVEDIERLIGPLCHPDSGSLINASPGRALRHYAPKTPIAIGCSSLQFPSLRKGLLSFTRQSCCSSREYRAIEVLSETGDLNEAACNLFAALRRLDMLKLDVIVTSTFPSHGLGLAINDRLTRASQPRII
jgi:L-threonylcarbamoyladenylate synthase